MPTAGCMRFSPEGRVYVTLLALPVAFNGGTPTAANGAVAVTQDDPEVFLGGFGYRGDDRICGREILPSGDYQGGLARDSAGGLALALTEPIESYIAGIPVVADGRVAVAILDPPLQPSGFDQGFDDSAFF